VLLHCRQWASRLSKICRLLAAPVAGWLITTISRPASAIWCWRNDSRIMRFTRFLCVARRQCFLEIARPSLALSRLLGLYNTVNNLSRLRPAFANTRPKAAASSSRLSLVKRLPGQLVLSVSGVVVTVTRRLRRQPCTAFGAPALDDKASGLGRHAGTESMRTSALQFAGLESAFHWLVTWYLAGRNPAVLLEGRQGYAGGQTVSID
jgi:hypothetical protein